MEYHFIKHNCLISVNLDHSQYPRRVRKPAITLFKENRNETKSSVNSGHPEQCGVYPCLLVRMRPRGIETGQYSCKVVGVIII